MTENKEELKNLLMKVKEETEKAGLTLNILKIKIMVSSPITSWQIEGGKVEAVTDFIFLSSKLTSLRTVNTAMKLKCLLHGRRAGTNLDSVFKNRDITLLTKVRILKAMVFPVVMYRCESWTIKKAEHQGTGAFKL